MAAVFLSTLMVQLLPGRLTWNRDWTELENKTGKIFESMGFTTEWKVGFLSKNRRSQERLAKPRNVSIHSFIQRTFAAKVDPQILGDEELVVFLWESHGEINLVPLKGRKPPKPMKKKEEEGEEEGLRQHPKSSILTHMYYYTLNPKILNF
ncbi:hypothetical protein HGM15179_016912 [Zosterops borbonicus]|uniref:Uncharacterized protein n=1 Tax=Zosterops borbonicus TaxID=364589 RepID=A0A8K1G259_9PASS|nr:hypothetical protein HGM15179_016912 [Zosterops borbonicus]